MCNGWTNYETWRIHLEIFDGMTTDEKVDDEYCQQYVEDLLEQESSPSSLVLSYATAFISKVNWREIAKAINDISELRLAGVN